MFDRKILRPWIRRFAVFLAVVIWTFSVIYTSLSYIAKANEKTLKEFADSQSGAVPAQEIDAGQDSQQGKEEGAQPEAPLRRKTDPDWMPLWLKKLALFSLRWGWLGVPIAAILELIRKWLVNCVRDRQTEKAIKRVVDYFFDETKPEDGKQINYRVTLFKYRKFSFTQLALMLVFKNKRNPWSGWLCPYERSGIFRNKTYVRWAASFEKVSENEGVVGRIFCEGTAVRIENLASKKELKESEKKRREYAKETNCSEPWVRKKALGSGDVPRSFWGTRVETSSNGTPWGVILIDSNLPELVESSVIEREVKIVLKMLSILLPSNKEN